MKNQNLQFLHKMIEKQEFRDIDSLIITPPEQLWDNNRALMSLSNLQKECMDFLDELVEQDKYPKKHKSKLFRKKYFSGWKWMN